MRPINNTKWLKFASFPTEVVITTNSSSTEIANQTGEPPRGSVLSPFSLYLFPLSLMKLCPDLWINLCSFLWARRMQDLWVHQLWKLQLHLQARLLRSSLRRYDWQDTLLQRCFSFLGGQERSTEQEFVSDSAMPQECGALPMKTMPPCWMSVIIQTDMASPCLLCNPRSDRRLMLQNNCFMAPFISLPTRGRASCLDLKETGFYEMAPLFGIHFLDI